MVQDPRGKGGTATVVDVYRRWMDRHRPDARREIWLDEHGPRGVRRLSRWNGEGRDIPRVLPALQIPPYVAARPAVRRRIGRRYEEIHVVGASAVHGSIARDLGPTLVWMATTVGDERTPDVLRQRPLTRRLAYTVTQPVLSRLEFDVLRNADRVLTMSRHTADVLVRMGLPSSRLEVVVVPVDTNRFHVPAEHDGRRGALFVGRAHDPRKGFDRLGDLLNGSELLSRRGISVVSPGLPIRSVGRVEWLGAVDDLVSTYQAAEILLLPSRQEGLGIVALEAMACGTPVVAWKCGGIDHILDESGGGITVPTVEDFTAAVERLLLDVGCARAMGEAGRSWIVRHAALSTFMSNTGVFSI